MAKELKPSDMKKYAFILFGIAILYTLVAIVDVMIKGYSDLSADTVIICIVLGGALLGYNFSAKKA